MRMYFAVGILAFVTALSGVGMAQDTGTPSPATVGDQRAAAGTEWPREIDGAGGKIMIYQPQPESFKGDTLTARAAVSVTPKDATNPVFGAVWFDAHVSTDRVARTVTIVSMEIPRVKFPEASADQEQKLADTLKSRLPAANLTFPLDNLLAGIALAEKEQVAVGSLETAPPKIIFSSVPAVLIVLDGKPELRPVEKTKLMRVVNTPFIIFLDPDTKSYYLKGGDRWYAATDITGAWAESANTPAAVVAAIPQDQGAAAAGGQGASAGASGPVRIIVATEPTELIVTDGAPTWTPIEGNQLLYLSNTENDVFMEIGSQQYYILLAGRWYRAAATSGPWAYVASDKLPPSFAKVPYDSPKGNVLVHVAGTEQAKEAVLDASIPQTTTVKPGPADLKVAYDGEPNFKKIEGTEMTYAANTTDSVIQVKKKYYCCRNAVWYAAKSPAGPWEVCTKVPKEVYTIPPSCPVYNVRYVNVYNATPEAVSVGYLPGYTGSYVLNNTVVYGTGFSYPPWPGPMYIPTPMTWGFCPVYNSWSGAWGYGSFPRSSGWVNWGNGHGGWWGPNGYHPVNWSAHNGQVNVNGRTYNANDYRNNHNLYRQGDHPAHAAQAAKSGALQAPRAAGNLANNVFADKNGNVFRKSQDGWEQRGGNGWTKNFAAPSESAAREIGQRFNEPARQDITRSLGQGGDRPAGSDFGGRDFSRPASSDFGRNDFSGMDRGFDRSDLESHSSARQRGMDRASDFNRGGFDRGGFDRGFGGGRGGGFHGGGGGFHGGGRR